MLPERNAGTRVREVGLLTPLYSPPPEMPHQQSQSLMDMHKVPGLSLLLALALAVPIFTALGQSRADSAAVQPQSPAFAPALTPTLALGLSLTPTSTSHPTGCPITHAPDR